MGEAPSLPTFCHISELGAFGYANLHRMVATSDPLYLWAPSSVLLKGEGCTVPPNDFLRYLEQGHIKIVARHPWLTDRRFRDHHAWEGAKWDPAIDDRIRSIYENDEAEPDVTKRRVVAAPDARGFERAEEFLEEHPSSLNRWMRVINGKTAEHVVPAGTLMAARREAATDPRHAVLVLLSTAHNHGQAMRDVDAQVPFLLNAQDPQFLNLIATMYAAPDQALPRSVVRRERRVHADLVELTQRLVATLERIETDRTRLDKFVGSEGHRDLVAWVAGMCERVKTTEPGSVDLDVRTALLDELERGVFNESRPVEFKRLLRSAEAPQTTAEISLAIAGLVEHERLGILSLAVSGFAVAHVAAKRMGLVPGDFTGAQWPFLYASGREATLKGRNRMENLLH
jgi:hypothetical protein